MSLTFTTWQTSISNLTGIPTSDANFASVQPNIIDDAELRLYRDLDLLNTVVRDSSAAVSINSPTFNLPSSIGTFVVVNEINIITPAGQTNPDSGTRNQVVPASREMLNAMWPSSSGSTVPQYFAPVSQSTVIFGAWPDQAYQAEVVGTIRPAALSSSNVTTLLSVYFPDLFIAASMVFAAGYMKNFGAQGDDPKMAVSWEAHYQSLLPAAKEEEARKKFVGEAWSEKAPAMAGQARV